MVDLFLAWYMKLTGNLTVIEGMPPNTNTNMKIPMRAAVAIGTVVVTIFSESLFIQTR